MLTTEGGADDTVFEYNIRAFILIMVMVTEA